MSSPADRNARTHARGQHSTGTSHGNQMYISKDRLFGMEACSRDHPHCMVLQWMCCFCGAGTHSGGQIHQCAQEYFGSHFTTYCWVLLSVYAILCLCSHTSWPMVFWLWGIPSPPSTTSLCEFRGKRHRQTAHVWPSWYNQPE